MHKVTPETPEIQFRELLPFRITSLKSADVGSNSPVTVNKIVS